MRLWARAGVTFTAIAFAAVSLGPSESLAGECCIELLGDRESRDAALASLRAMLSPGALAACLLQKESITHPARFYLAIDPSTTCSGFRYANKVARRLSELIASPFPITFQVVLPRTVVTDDLGVSLVLGADQPGASGIFGGRIGVRIIPPWVPAAAVPHYLMQQDTPGITTPGILSGHELLGHCLSIVRQALRGRRRLPPLTPGDAIADTQQEAVDAENDVRELLFPGGNKRLYDRLPRPKPAAASKAGAPTPSRN